MIYFITKNARRPVILDENNILLWTAVDVFLRHKSSEFIAFKLIEFFISTTNIIIVMESNQVLLKFSLNFLHLSEPKNVNHGFIISSSFDIDYKLGNLETSCQKLYTLIMRIT